MCIMLAVLSFTGCQSMNRSRSGGPGSSENGADSADRAALVLENKGLKSEVETRDLDLAKLRAEYQRQLDLNAFLLEEMEHLKRDLGRVERQFISFEKRLQVKESKASAVAALAEVQLLFDKLQSSETNPLDSLTVSEVAIKLETSDELLKQQNYAAAVYYANRAMRILNQKERLQNMTIPDGDAKIIVVSVANLREGPGSKYRVVEKLSYGTVVVQLGSEEEWCQIRTQSGQSGWVHDSLVR